MKRTSRHGTLWTVLLACVAMLLGLVAFSPRALADEKTSGATIDDPDAALEELFSDDANVSLLTNLLAEAGGQPEGLIATSDVSLRANADDGSAPVGRLKILARYNDDMSFYDGHVYLLFTSYQDGVTFTVNDLYGAYDISNQYYKDIAADISHGSNHTGNDTDQYFTFSDSLKTVTLNRGEIVTVGMYRGFDLSVPQAALGSIQNSTLWSKLSDEAKSSLVTTFFEVANSDSLDVDGALDNIRAVLAEYGSDINNLLDGVVEGGVCFNRELYNQKLEWDQYENVTYEMDITQAQLDTMALYLTGNLNKFSILKNSCATVAVRAWNAIAGEDDQLVMNGSGIYQYIDAPKSVRDAIRDTFEGREDYHWNSSEGGEQADPEAGYADDTGWVYVSAPEPVEPVAYVYEGDDLRIDADRSKMGSLVTIARQGQTITYAKDHQEITVSFDTSTQGDVTTVNGVSFDIDGTVVSLDKNSALADGIWLKAKVGDQGESCYVTDAGGNVLPSDYSDGWISFHADALPVSYQIKNGESGSLNLLTTTIVNGDKAKPDAPVYRIVNGEKQELGAKAEVPSGEKIYISPKMLPEDFDYMLTGITFNGASVMDAEHYDAEQAAYVVTMPQSYAKLNLTYEMAVLSGLNGEDIQVEAGTTLDVADYAHLLVGEGDDWRESDLFSWTIIDDVDGTVAYEGDDHRTLKAQQEGPALVVAMANGNENILGLFFIEVYDNRDNMVEVVFPEDDVDVMVAEGDESMWRLPYSGYLVKKGVHATVVPIQTDGKVVSSLENNRKDLAPGEVFDITEDANIEVSFKKATIKGMPERVELAATGDSYQLEAEVRYSGLIDQFRSVYDPSIIYESSNPLVSVDETGLITVTGEVPEGGAAAYITAYAGSSNRSLYAQTKVVVGDYDGDQIVGRLTIHARRIAQAELIAHGCVTFTTYDDRDLSVSYYHYYEPTAEYKRLMEDYRDHPEKYEHDPALYNNNELGLENRESYFIQHYNGAGSAPETISMRCGESITLSNYCYDPSNLHAIKGTMESGDLSNSENAQEFVRQMNLYIDGSDEFDGASAFDSMLSTLVEMYVGTELMGQNPADGHTTGGMDVNRELFNEFRRDDSQLPNAFYTVEITADELAAMEAYLADPSNNYYSLFNMNCASGAANIWNAALFDRPELAVAPSYTQIADDPESLYFEMLRLRLETGKTYDPDVEHSEGGGEDFYPRTVACGRCVEGQWKRLSGKDRYETMAAIVKEGFVHSDTAVLASGANFPDALVASSVAGQLGCPVVLTTPDKLSDEAASRLKALGVKNVWVMGSDKTITSRVLIAVEALGIAHDNIQRIAGTDRQATSLEAMRWLDERGGYDGTVVIASGTSFPDALAIGPCCFKDKVPILLADGSGNLSDDQYDALAGNGLASGTKATTVVILGGTNRVTDETRAKIAEVTGIDPEDEDCFVALAGEDRYETAAMIAGWEITARGMGLTNVTVATGQKFPDALSGAPLCGGYDSVLILAKDQDSAGLALINKEAGVKTGYVLGDANAISDELFSYLESLTK